MRGAATVRLSETVRAHYSLIAALAVSACKANTPATKATSTAAAHVVSRWEPVVRPPDSNVVPQNHPAASDDSSYRAALAASLLPDEAPAARVAPLPSDDTNLSNYQSSGWWLGWSNDQSTHSRFSADFDRFTSGVLIFKIDTLLARDQKEPPFDGKLADSVAIRGLSATERFATGCRFGTRPADERITGVVPDSTRERWMQPRLAWLIDTVTARIRRIRPDSIACALEPDPD